MTFDLDQIEAAAKNAVPWTDDGWSSSPDEFYGPFHEIDQGGIFAAESSAALMALMTPERVLALVEVVKAAQNFITTYNNATVLTDTTDARVALKAALKPFGDEQSSSSGGKTA